MTDQPLSSEAEYALEAPIRCSGCEQDIDEMRVVRLLRSRVNFTSTLPRRGYVTVCPKCRTVVSALLSTL